MTEAYPLAWPPHRPRTKRRQRSQFHSSFDVARDGLMDELRRMGARLPVLSTNVPLRRDGLPYAVQKEPDDPGVAVYFEWKGRQMAFACDRWDRVRDNVQAVRHTIAALRGLDRWGTGDMVEAAFRGFEALPPPDASDRQWRDVLNLTSMDGLQEAEASYRHLATERHPDRGGSTEQMAELNAAIRQARKDFGR